MKQSEYELLPKNTDKLTKVEFIETISLNCNDTLYIPIRVLLLLKRYRNNNKFYEHLKEIGKKENAFKIVYIALSIIDYVDYLESCDDQTEKMTDEEFIELFIGMFNSKSDDKIDLDIINQAKDVLIDLQYECINLKTKNICFMIIDMYYANLLFESII
jgi:hypothetical protein